MRDFLIKNSIVFVIQKWFVTNWISVCNVARAVPYGSKIIE